MNANTGWHTEKIRVATWGNSVGKFTHGKLRSLPRRQKSSTDGRKIMNYTMKLVAEYFDRVLMDENLPESLSEWLDNTACDDSIPTWIWNIVFALDLYESYIDANG